MDKLTKPLEITSILNAVSDQGEQARGKAIFARKDLQCVNCHRVGRDGGRVGPELSGLGGSAQLPDILQALIDPSGGLRPAVNLSEWERATC